MPSVTVLVSYIVKEDLKFLVSLVWNGELGRKYIYIYMAISNLLFQIEIVGYNYKPYSNGKQLIDTCTLTNSVDPDEMPHFAASH